MVIPIAIKLAIVSCSIHLSIFNVFYFSFGNMEERKYEVRIFDIANAETDVTNMVRFTKIYLEPIANSITIKILVHHF